MHMMKEEKVLFPYVVRMEEAVFQREPVLPPPFGSVQNPVPMMEHEHDCRRSPPPPAPGQRQLRPAGRCLHQLPHCTRPWKFEADLHQHIHLENNILFPRAIAMEESALNSRPKSSCICGPGGSSSFIYIATRYK